MLRTCCTSPMWVLSSSSWLCGGLFFLWKTYSSDKSTWVTPPLSYIIDDRCMLYLIRCDGQTRIPFPPDRQSPPGQEKFRKISAMAAIRGSRLSESQSQDPSLRLRPHNGQSPAQSSLQRVLVGSATTISSITSLSVSNIHPSMKLSSSAS